MKIKIKELKEGFTPTYTRNGDACLDCRAAIEMDSIKIPSHSRFHRIQDAWFHLDLHLHFLKDMKP